MPPERADTAERKTARFIIKDAENKKKRCGTGVSRATKDWVPAGSVFLPIYVCSQPERLIFMSFVVNSLPPRFKRLPWRGM